MPNLRSKKLNKNLGAIYVVFSLIITGLFLSAREEIVLASDCGDGEYVVSAYYSPLPGQERYATGTYVGDIRLNGGGVVTASGVKVADAPGAFVASPSCYSFGTVLEFAGMGNYLVLDRGGAIQGKRLDLWTGYGDEGLNAALAWGKRTVSVRSLGEDAEVTLEEKAAWKVPPDRTYLLSIPSNPFELIDNISLGDTGASVAVLQQLLIDIGYYNGEVDGYFGSKTKQALLEMDSDYGEIVSVNISPLGALGSTSIDDVEKLVINARKKYVEELPNTNLGKGATGPEVLNLQKALRKLGYKVDFSEEFDDLTEQALIKFQIEYGIINDASSLAAGYFGAESKQKMEIALNNALPDEIAEDVESDYFEFLPLTEQLTTPLRKGSEGDDVRKLQELLTRMNLFKVDPTGYYGPLTEHAVTKLQLKYGLITSLDDNGAGEVGPATRRFINKFHNAYLGRLQLTLKQKNVETEGLFSKELSRGDNNNDVFVLQKFLQEQGYLNSVLLTKYYGDQTFEAMAQFKLDNGLIEDGSILNSGNLDRRSIEFINARFK